MPTNRGIGDRIKEERRRFKLTQQEVADYAGVGRNTQINYEMGHRSPPADYLQKLEKMGLDACYILLGRRSY